MIFACPARFSSQALSQHVTTFEYEFNDANAPQLFLPPVSFPYGAAHASEIQYLLHLTPTPLVPSPPALSADQQKLSDQMIGYWTRFAATGDPNDGHRPAWPRVAVGTEQILSLLPPSASIETGFTGDHQCAFWHTFTGH